MEDEVAVDICKVGLLGFYLGEHLDGISNLAVTGVGQGNLVGLPLVVLEVSGRFVGQIGDGHVLVEESPAVG